MTLFQVQGETVASQFIQECPDVLDVKLVRPLRHESNVIPVSQSRNVGRAAGYRIPGFWPMGAARNSVHRTKTFGPQRAPIGILSHRY